MTASDGRVAFWFTVVALAAAVAWPAFLWIVPGFISSETPVGLFGVLAVPVVIALIAWVGLHARCSHGSTVGFVAAAGLVGLLNLATFVGMASFGLLSFPAASLLLVAVLTTPKGLPASAERRGGRAFGGRW